MVAHCPVCIPRLVYACDCPFPFPFLPSLWVVYPFLNGLVVYLSLLLTGSLSGYMAVDKLAD